MPSGQVQHTSNSDFDPRDVVDQRKQKRMLSNRESARKSRMRKQQHLGNLINQVDQLKKENEKIKTQMNVVTQQYSEMESGNLILRAQLMELTEHLKSLNSFLHYFEDFSGMEIDIPEIPDPLLKPWQLPCTTQAILASSSELQS